MDHQLVDIVALCFNHENFVKYTLDSIIKQSYEHINLIIADDSSSDNSVAAIQNWIDTNSVECTFIKNPNNLGVNKTLNKTIKYCKGSYFKFIACDDILNKHYIERCINQLQDTTDDVGMVFSNMDLIDENNVMISDSYFDESRLETIHQDKVSFFHKLLVDYFIPAPATLYKTAAIKNVGPYDESLSSEDYDFNVRFSRKYDYRYLDENLVSYRRHGQNLSHTFYSKSTLEMMQKVVLKHINDLDLTNVEKEEIVKLIRRNIVKSYREKLGWSFRWKLYMNFLNKTKDKGFALSRIWEIMWKVTKLRLK